MMAFVDWLRASRRRFNSQSPRDAFVDSLHELYIGGLRRLAAVQSIEYDVHWDYDWDILVILDACRVDLLKRVASDREWLPPESEIGSITSLGSTSSEWIERMFSDEFRDEIRRTAYVTGNMFYQHVDLSDMPVVSAVPPESIPEFGITTVPPRRLTELAVDGWRRREKLGFERLIVHYMQPHTPFRSRPEWYDPERELRTGWGESFAELRDGDIDRPAFIEAYRDNLEWVLDDVAILKDNVNATLGISADHGNGLGEWGVYGHPGWINVQAVREVPYAEVEGVDWGTYEPEARLEKDAPKLDNEEVKQHLAALGYR